MSRTRIGWRARAWFCAGAIALGALAATTTATGASPAAGYSSASAMPAAKDLRVEYPIAIDNDYAIWSAFNKPLLAGPLFRRCAGAYSTSSIGGIGRELVSVEARGAEAAADWGSLKSPETMSAMSAPRTLRLPAVQFWTRVASMLPPPG